MGGLAQCLLRFRHQLEIYPLCNRWGGLSYFEGDLRASSTGQSFDDSGYGLTYQAGAGLKYRPRDNLAYTFGYRYLDTLELDMGDMDIDYSSHEFRIGLEYNLDWGRKKY